MNEVKVKRQDLLTKLKENRAAHRGEFLKAQEGYRKAVIDELDKMLADAKDGKPINRGISLPEPQDHTDDYDQVITMMEMSVDDVIELPVQDFRTYVMDNWAWSGLVKSTASFYQQH